MSIADRSRHDRAREPREQGGNHHRGRPRSRPRSRTALRVARSDSDDDRERQGARALRRARQLHRTDRPYPVHVADARHRRGHARHASSTQRTSRPSWPCSPRRRAASTARCSASTAARSASTPGGRSPRRSRPRTAAALRTPSPPRWRGCRPRCRSTTRCKTRGGHASRGLSASAPAFSDAPQASAPFISGQTFTRSTWVPAARARARRSFGSDV